MKFLKYIYILIFLFVGINSVSAFDNSLKIYDYGQILTEKEELDLKEKVDKYINKYNVDMVIVTVKYYNQTTLNEYIKLFYEKNNFDSNGIIVVVDLKKDKTKVGIETFGKVKNYYSESEIETIINKMNKEDDYYDKLKIFINESFNYIDKFDTSYSNQKNILSSINWFDLIMLSVIIPTIITLIGIFKNKNVKKEENAKYYINSIIINKREDKFITTNTKKERISK